MRIHIRECIQCGRISLRINTESTWCQWRSGGYMMAIAQKHNVLTHRIVVCPTCQDKQTLHITQAAGINTAQDLDSGL